MAETVSLLIALFGLTAVLAGRDAKVYFVWLAYLPAVAFWALDGYFLWQERMYRELYDAVRQGQDDSDFSMSAWQRPSREPTAKD